MAESSALHLLSLLRQPDQTSAVIHRREALPQAIATEKASHPKRVIALHDCCPFSHEMTTRDRNNTPRRVWTGDVWKLIPILARHRPDMTVTVRDASPTGIDMVSVLNPKSNGLEKAYAQIVAGFTDLTPQDFGLQAFNDSFDCHGTTTFIAAGSVLLDDVAPDPAQALKQEKVTP